MDEGVVFSCEEVYGEIKKQDDALFKWAKERVTVFKKPTQEVLEQLKQVMSRFPNFAAQGGSTNRADPFVIAHAWAVGAIVVTDEERADRQKATKPPKIPNACDKLGLSWMTPIDFLAAIGIEL